MNPKTFIAGSPSEALRMRIVYALFGTAFFLPLNIFVMEACFITAVFMSAYYTWKYDMHIWRYMPLFWPAAAFSVTAFLSLAGSPKAVYGVAFYFFTVVQYFLIYNMIVTFIRGERERRILLYCFLAGAVCVAVYGLYQYTAMQGLHDADWVDTDAFPLLQRRMYSTLYNPNLLSAYLLMVMGITASLTLWTRHNVHRIIYGALFVLFTFCLILTYSRGGWVSVFALVFFFGLVWDKRIWLLFLIVPLVLAFYHGGVVNRLLSIFSNCEDTSVTMRLDMWESTFYMICDHPILGVGWGAYKYVYPLYNELIQEAGITIYHAHNMYFNIMAETGIVGFFFYMWFFFGTAWYGLRVLKENGDTFDNCIAMGAASVIAALAVSGISDYDLFSTQISLTLWFLCGLLSNIYIEMQKK
jgi:putative inorganic carbon (hco3(-)) transporter